jgi:branched-chain amino acid transport system ATP-binding protein
LLKLTDVDTYYGELQALRGVDLEIEEGQIASMVGSNGAGKSTTLNTISGVVRCASGEITFFGHRIDNLPPHKIVELGLVQIPEARLLFADMTVLENLELGAFNLGAREKMSQSLSMVYELFPVLEERQKQWAGTLSGGEQQMAAIARGLMAAPKLLMLDEPSLGLAPILVRHVFDTVQQINERGITIFLVEQNVFHSLSISHNAHVLENGHVVLSGSGKTLLENPRVREAYLGI